MQEYLKSIQWATVAASVVIVFVLLFVLGRR
jgi:hypothetical protein